MEQPRDLGQVQADEIRVKHQGGIAWLAMALQVTTRLWLGGVVSAHRDGELITRLIQRVRRCALYRGLQASACLQKPNGRKLRVEDWWVSGIPGVTN